MEVVYQVEIISDEFWDIEGWIKLHNVLDLLVPLNQ